MKKNELCQRILDHMEISRPCYRKGCWNTDLEPEQLIEGTIGVMQNIVKSVMEERGARLTDLDWSARGKDECQRNDDLRIAEFKRL